MRRDYIFGTDDGMLHKLTVSENNHMGEVSSVCGKLFKETHQRCLDSRDEPWVIKYVENKYLDTACPECMPSSCKHLWIRTLLFPNEVVCKKCNIVSKERSLIVYIGNILCILSEDFGFKVKNSVSTY